MFGKKKDSVDIEVDVPDFSAFEYAVQAGKTDEAVIVGSNLLNQHPSNAEFFVRFFDWICERALQSNDLLTKEGYYGLANDACSSFTLLMDLTQDNIAIVTKCRGKLQYVLQDRYKAQQSAEEQSRRAIIRQNRVTLDNIRAHAGKIDSCSTHKELEDLSKKIVKADREINRDLLPELQDEYDDLMKEVSEKISARSTTLTRKANLLTNQQAVETYKRILLAFKGRESYFSKKEADIRSFYSVLDTAFKYKESDLYPETLAYYSYVYNFILSTVQDQQKYDLTLHLIKVKGEANESC